MADHFIKGAGVLTDTARTHKARTLPAGKSGRILPR
jgi:hypothetical protein